MNVRYIQAESLMSLLLPKRAVLLPWRHQPNVLFAYTFDEWQTFASRQKSGHLLEYRKILQLPIEQQMQYFYADACMSQFYEIAFSGGNATNILATERVCSENKITELLSTVNTSGIANVAEVVGKASLYKQAITLPSKLSTACLLYCYGMSMKGEADIWKIK